MFRLANDSDTGKEFGHWGGSQAGYVRCSYAELVSLFGKPGPSPDGDGKVTTSWYVRNESTREVIEVYDYKATNKYDPQLPSVKEFRERPSYDWHVGGASQETLQAFADWLGEKLGHRVPRGEWTWEIA